MVVLTEIGVEPQCQALNLSNSIRCTAQATASNNLFCRFHARQCFGLYMGYKKRNAQLDALTESAAAYLRAQRVPLQNQTFDGVDDEAKLRDIHSYLFTHYVLLGKVISARNLHHKHFYPLDMDYGHKAYLDRLVTQRRSVLRALENVERRTAVVLYEKEKWFTWVRQVQSEEETNREKEQKKVKMEAALFRRHWREMQARLDAAREREEKRRQEAYLDEVWRERMEADDVSDEDDAAWDPIDDVVEDDRGMYLDLVRHFLSMDMPQPAVDTDALAGADNATSGAVALETEVAVDEVEPATKDSSPGKSEHKQNDNSRDPEKGKIEGKDEIRQRLREGVKKDYKHRAGPMLFGTVQNPVERMERTAPMPDDEIDKLIADITEIKRLLFCRQLLSHAALLPAALRAGSVEEFLNDAELAESDIRDLCLKLDQPDLQALRDACADFARGDELHEPEEEEDEPITALEVIKQHLLYRDLGVLGRAMFREVLSSSSRKIMGERQDMVEEIEAEPKSKRMKVRVCGKNIWNHTSERSMARDGWLQFSILAKDCSFKDAIALCRNWDEFFELNILSYWQYFPASKWWGWGGNHFVDELCQMGFVTFHSSLGDKRETFHMQTGSRGRVRRKHAMVESKNFVCAYMKRNDPVSRRFIQYALMAPSNGLILVRDGKTSRILTAPNEEDRWLVRSKFGLGRASKSEWEIEDQIDAFFMHFAVGLCDWRFTLNDYYEVYMWDFVPGLEPMELLGHIQQLLQKAHRMRVPADKFSHIKPLLSTLTIEEPSQRVRQIRPGEQTKSIYDSLTGPEASFSYYTNQTRKIKESPSGVVPLEIANRFYNETDAVEDAVLFPEEALGAPDSMPFREIMNPIQQLEAAEMPLTVLNHQASLLEQMLQSDNTKLISDEKGGPSQSDSQPEKPSVPSIEEFSYSIPPAFVKACEAIDGRSCSAARVALLERLDYAAVKLDLTMEKVHDIANKMEIMERDRSYAFKESFHLGDLEPGARDKYAETMELIIGMLKFEPPVVHDGWVWFCMELIDWLGLQLYYDEYNMISAEAWPHRYIIHDMCQAFMMMGIFFPDLEVARITREYLSSKDGARLKSSAIFDPTARSKTLPDRRSARSSSMFPKTFWKQWKNAVVSDEKAEEIHAYQQEAIVAIRPIIAKLYRAGVVAPAHLESDPRCVLGVATANTEAPRPDKPDLFINYDNEFLGPPRPPPNFVPYQDWPVLLPLARDFVASCKLRGKERQPRFALLRLWSAPHFYPLMLGLNSRQATSFIDTVGRSWEWRFIPRDFVLSDWSVHSVVAQRLLRLREQIVREGKRNNGNANGRVVARDVGDLYEHVANRGDLILVMGEDETDLLRWCTAVTFALQTKPWLREVDLWKSFVNVDLEFLEALDAHWLD
ncbi:hypothetical protein QBC46DRAFT_422732 [Diplogelasinospora grovesii]|uniref:Uncharacterized protein n=1 Tax=Diplogelasinospora grovesii TaxID=303347 RepID=A0AAN6MXM6_9PEZI|nr:hypothetical protein QBC46DRAFT_422732 [Diplogelasinospora grovesii]